MSGGAGTGGAGAPRVVVGIDGSVGARAALRQALHEARRRGARLDVVAAFISPERLAVVNRLPIVTEREAVAAAAEAAARTEVDEVVAGDLAEHPDAPAPPIAVRAVAGRPREHRAGFGRLVVSAERSLPAHRRPSAGRAPPGGGHRRPGRGGPRGGRREPPVSPLGEHP
ncbi:universal stress protein [Actinomycetospora callitridis]|nr:universal stress protein [Actinomycetospora callitridis]MDD7918798.1 universal stress protein [Actinomycetospora callitridis]